MCVCVCVESSVLVTRVRAVKSAHTGKTRSHPSARSLIGPLRPLDLLCFPHFVALPVNGALYIRSLAPHYRRTWPSVGRKGEAREGTGVTPSVPTVREGVTVCWCNGASAS